MRDNLFNAAIGDTQVLCRGTADKTGAAESSSWLFRAGQTALALGVQVGEPCPLLQGFVLNPLAVVFEKYDTDTELLRGARASPCKTM